MANTAKQPLGKRIFAYLIQNRPDQFFAVLRLFKPILQMPKAGPVIVTRWDDVQEVLQRPQVFTVEKYAPMMDPSVGPFMLARDGTVYNERDKGIMRSMLQQADLPRVREIAARLARDAVAQGVQAGQLEVVSQLSRKVPVQLTGEYFGFPGPDMATMMRWSRATQYDMFHNLDNDPQIHQDNIAAGQEMRAWLQAYLPQVRETLQGDPQLDHIVARLLKARLPDAIGFDQERIMSNTMGLLVGGVETTSQAIVQILDQFFKRPDAMLGARQAALVGDDELLFQYCWEALRFNPINPFVVRYCVQDYELAAGTCRKTTIKAGRVVLVSGRSAMRDGRQVPQPSEFRTDRPYYHYLHMGYGMHTCLGNYVGEIEIPEVIKALLLKKNLRRAPGKAGEIDFKGGPFPESFSVCFDD